MLYKVEDMLLQDGLLLMKIMLEFLGDMDGLNHSLYLSFQEPQKNHFYKSDVKAIFDDHTI
jgi:hypothetical protein